MWRYIIRSFFSVGQSLVSQKTSPGTENVSSCLDAEAEYVIPSKIFTVRSFCSSPNLSPNTSQKCGCFSRLLICLHTLSPEQQMYMVKVFLMLPATCGMSMEVFIQVSLLYVRCFRFLPTARASSSGGLL